MSNSTALIRIRFPHDVVERLDQLAERLHVKNMRSVPRAAVVRALVQIHMTAAADGLALAAALGADPVKRGRQKGSCATPPQRASSRSSMIGAITGESR